MDSRSAGGRRLTQDVRDHHPGNVASEHGEEGAQAADQQAELGERQRPRLAAPWQEAPLQNHVYLSGVLLFEGGRLLQEESEGVARLGSRSGRAVPARVDDLPAADGQKTSVKCPRGSLVLHKSCAPGGGLQHRSSQQRSAHKNTPTRVGTRSQSPRYSPSSLQLAALQGTLSGSS